MRIKRIHLRNFKRFTDLEVVDLPATAKLIVVVGPNGSGKSSLFDAFLKWYRPTAGFGNDNDISYFQKDRSTGSVGNTVSVETFEGAAPTKESVYFRSAYRNEAEFAVGAINRLNRPTEELRLARSIQNDQVVGQNYQRLIYDTVSGVYSSDNDGKTVEALRNELIGEIRKSMERVFGDLILNNISDPLGEGTFLFKKGPIDSYQYKNLSGGEKAAFDLLLDMHLKKSFYIDAVWCVDELETHLHTRVQGALLREMYHLVPERSQLWVTTHSLGVMRTAQALSVEAPGTVAIIDFDGADLDQPARLAPSSIGRIAWEKMVSIAIDDLSSRLVPCTIVVCEGSAIGGRRKNFDAEIYNRILGQTSAEVTFVSGGSSSQLVQSGIAIKGALEDIAHGAKVISLCDRDDKSAQEVMQYEQNGNLVLPERNLESYLFADDVLCKLLEASEQPEKRAEAMQIKADAIAASTSRGNPADDLKSASGTIFIELKKLLNLSRPGNNADAFMRDTLAPLIVPDMPTYAALKTAILDRL